LGNERREGAVKRRRKTRRRERRSAALEDRGGTVELLREVAQHTESGPPLAGGDVDADWQRAQSTGEETVGGHVATPDQDVVDEIGHALGVDQAPDAVVVTSEEILRTRDRHYWHLEREAARREEEREAEQEESA
jgi:hypothetical protein